MQIEINRPAGVKLLTCGKLCPADLIVTPVLQHKTVTENGMVTPDAGFAGLSGVQVNVAGGGACDRPHILTVDTLPTEHMDENAVYLCGGKYYKCGKEFLDIVILYGGSPMSMKEMVAEQGMPFGLYIIPTKTAEGILSSDDGMYFYYIQDEDNVFTYINGQWESMPCIIISDISVATENGQYAIITNGWLQMTIPSGEIVITKDGTYDVAGKRTATVNTQSITIVQTSAELPEDAILGSMAIVLGGE